LHAGVLRQQQPPVLHVENVRFSGQNFELLENCFTTPRALQSDFVGVEGRKMILSMSPSELVQRSAVNGLGFGLFQLQAPTRTGRCALLQNCESGQILRKEARQSEGFQHKLLLLGGCIRSKRVLGDSLRKMGTQKAAKLI
jgi:hypothetical protein